MDLPRPDLLVDCAPAPNPRRVGTFLAEKGVRLPVEQVDIIAGEQFAADAARVGSHHVPALRLAHGRWQTESVAIRRYVEALWPAPNLMGRDFLRPTRFAWPEDCAALRAWRAGLTRGCRCEPRRGALVAGQRAFYA